MIDIRRATPGDAAALLALQLRLDEESSFMLLQPGERAPSPSPSPSPSFVLLGMADEGVAAGYVEVEVLPYARARRTGYVVMGVRAAYAGQGLGRRLLDRAAQEARTAGMARLELTVMTHNQRALGLYLSCGYQVEGLRRSALDVDGRRVDEYYMGLLLEV
ncbi:GNAT family N-acetyltransferase [Nonomuraea rubra]|uniref:Ribosomal protein S18 acetylase RimI-like enzyme n=1 Tax=Nonomuraea rubra TaxID=46180 RepID=A0A7X0NM06_9ACTN|nr:GNAT family N-acetyltransferase [Nonomuraea rubra]MBB6545736.1 ribosomal protein S18 acetylase RimI-like enzyme [Nonomuraea rubra]